MSRPTHSLPGTMATDRESRSYPSRSTSPGYTVSRIGGKGGDNFIFDATHGRLPSSVPARITIGAQPNDFSEAETVSIDSAGIAQFEKLMNRAAAFGNRVQPFSDKSRASVSSGIGGPSAHPGDRPNGRHVDGERRASVATYDALSRTSTVVDSLGSKNSNQPASATKQETTAPPTPMHAAELKPRSQSDVGNVNNFSSAMAHSGAGMYHSITQPPPVSRDMATVLSENDWLRQRLRTLTDSYESALDAKERDIQKSVVEVRRLKKKVAKECPAINGISLAHLKHSNERLSAQLARLEIATNPAAAAAAALALVSHQQTPQRGADARRGSSVKINNINESSVVELQDKIQQQDAIIAKLQSDRVSAADAVDEEEGAVLRVRECEAAIGALMSEIDTLDRRLRDQISRSDDDRTQLQRMLEQQQSQFNVERLECDRVVHALSAKLEELAKENAALRRKVGASTETTSHN